MVWQALAKLGAAIYGASKGEGGLICCYRNEISFKPPKNILTRTNGRIDEVESACAFVNGLFQGDTGRSNPLAASILA